MAKKFSMPGHSPIRISTLRPDSMLAMNVYIPVSGRPVRYGALNETLEAARLSRLKTYGLNKVWIREEDETLYRKYLTDILADAETNTKMTMNDRTAAVSSAAESAAQNILERPEDKNVYLNSLEHFERFARFLKNNQGSFTEILRLSEMTTQEDYITHGVQVAALTLYVCEQLKLIRNEKHQTSIITGTFLHDIGSETEGLPRIDASEMDAEQKKIWKDHPQKGAAILNNKDYVDKQVMDIILEHEEIPNGSGFPRSLNQKNMDPVAVVVSLANSFDHYSQKYKNDKPLAQKEFTKDYLGKYDLSYVELIGRFIKEHGAK